MNKLAIAVGLLLATSASAADPIGQNFWSPIKCGDWPFTDETHASYCPKRAEQFQVTGTERLNKLGTQTCSRTNGGWTCEPDGEPYYRVKFASGRQAFIKVSSFDAARADGTITREDPKVLAARWKARGGVRIGMTRPQVLASQWGRPERVHQTILPSGTSEQWVYGSGNYLYFTEGVLTAIQKQK